MSPPRVIVHCRGTHEEESTDSDGRTTTTDVPDFDFDVDITSALIQTPQDVCLWTVPDGEPAYRGKLWRQVDDVLSPQSDRLGNPRSPPQIRRRIATSVERIQANIDTKRREDFALPPWASLPSQISEGTAGRLLNPADRIHLQNACHCAVDDYSDNLLLPASKTIANFAEEFCASWRPLREFRFQRTVYGWDFDDIEGRVRGILGRYLSGPNPKSSATVRLDVVEVVVRPKNILWTLLSNRILMFFLWITFIYPILVWPIRKFILGGTWKVAGSSFAFVKYVHMEDSYPGETTAAYAARDTCSHALADLKVTTRGVSALQGQRFSEWIRSRGPQIGLVAGERRRTGQRNPLVLL